MMQLQPRDRVVVVGIGLKGESLAELKESMAELEELAHAAGGDIVGSATQIVQRFHPATLLGSGKVQEIKEMVEQAQANVVVVDHQLSGVQTRNLEKEWKARVLDRSQLILDIFALRAHTYEGKLQVQLAQLLDQLPRMVDAWMGSLSRQAGGIGTRGPGETALEMDRRRIRKRVKHVKKQLEEVRVKRQQLRAQRKKNRIPGFALVGYTNSGKSTLLNQLTKANVLEEDQLFATLDPTTRKVHLDGGPRSVVTDTVGFIRNLPPHLIEAFKATLEESSDADVLIHVVDLSSEQMDRQMETVNRLIQEFGWDQKPIIYVFNKIDKAPFQKRFQVKAFPRVFISAKEGEGIDRLKALMTESLESLYQEVELFFPKNEEHKIFELGRESRITRKEPASQGTVCHVNMTPSQLTRWKPYLVGSGV